MLKSKSLSNSFFILAATLVPTWISGLSLPARADDYHPDPRSVQRLDSAYRYPRAGWIVMHIEGKPYERGVQHGKLLAAEIAAYVNALAAFNEPKAPATAWRLIRQLTAALFLKGFSQEQLQEMKGIADGASALGATFDDRPLDLLDIVALNTSSEFDALDGALQATPTGLESLYLTNKLALPKAGRRHARQRARQHCTAFAAVGPATRDGKVVFGHITMFDLYPANFDNIWMDVTPATGHHFIMQTFPGGIYSGMDYTITDTGLLISETNVDQTGFKPDGLPLAARVREATQYADGVEQAANILGKNGNGLCTSEWILADVKRNEIALLVLGTHAQKLYRSSKNEWIADAKGFYWSVNNAKDSAVRQETIASFLERPSADVVFRPSKRDVIWLQLYDRYQGRMDLDFARLVLTRPELDSAFAVDAKYTTTDLALQFKSWATFGPPVGGIWRPTATELHDFPKVKPLVSNPWVLLSPITPERSAESESPQVPVADLPDLEDEEPLAAKPKEDDKPETLPAAWHGTLLPETDADIWLATAFAEYERIVEKENFLRQQSDGQLAVEDMDEIAVEVCYHRSLYELGSRSATEVPLARTKADFRDENWHRVACGKGVLLLHSLRGLVGARVFDRLMDEFGRKHAGEKVTAAQFQAHVEKGIGKNLKAFFDEWLNQTGLPRVQLGSIETKKSGKQWVTTMTVERIAGGVLVVPVTVETTKSEVTQFVSLEQRQASIQIGSKDKPLRVVLDKYGLTACGNGSPFTILTFDTEVDQTLIVYGTLDEAVANQEAARVLQQALRRREHNIKPIIKSDTEVTEDDLKTHHLLLVGRPSTNSIAKRFEERLPVAFGRQSFEVRGSAYAHPESAVIVAVENPLNRRYSLVTIAGLSALSTLNAVSQFEGETLGYAPVVVLPYNQEELDFVAAPKEFVKRVE